MVSKHCCYGKCEYNSMNKDRHHKQGMDFVPFQPKSYFKCKKKKREREDFGTWPTDYRKKAPFSVKKCEKVYIYIHEEEVKKCAFKYMKKR